jgi:eukaryotic-like serine/threonine-protein kinase
MMDPPPRGEARAPPPQERWRRIEAILDTALDLRPGERAGWVREACADEPGLREEVEHLLRAHERAAGFLETSARDFAAPYLADLVMRTPPLAPGTRVGPYRVVREVGRGGMGAVYLAERDDGQYHQRVALKVVPAAWALDDDLLRRFRHERQILASLEHPGIARLMDGGVTGDGLPYFVMEYVEGIPIDRYCDDHRLSVEARLVLLCEVCDAVQHAHGRGIVHRDLKPSNVLAAGPPPAADDATTPRPDGRVKLLDFGIATVVDPASALPAELTRPGLRRLTPEYASPEQIRGDPVTPASDVYSLGVLLHRLLAGGTAPGGRRRVRGDLEAIALAALAPEPGARYPTAGELAADLRRYLARRPVAAPGGGRLGRAGRLV